jgi:4-hydroxymandelate oxidase
VYVDGGVRNGRHALTALALGARAVFLGRLPLYALAVEGADGVQRLLAELTEELADGMRLAGCADVDGVPRDLLAPRRVPAGAPAAPQPPPGPTPRRRGKGG